MAKNLLVKNSNKIKENRLFNTINVIALAIISIVCFVPFLNVLSVALSTAGNDINFTPKFDLLKNH